MLRAVLGRLEVSAVGLGCNNFGRALDAEEARRVVDAALEHGMNFFDTAANYGDGQSEAFLGRALAGRRGEAVIATKFGMPRPDEDRGGASAAAVRRSTLRSLEELGTDVIDLLQLHKPDPAVPIAETLGAMWDLVDEGIVREIGCSNLDAGQLREAAAVARDAGRLGFISNQVHYSLVYPEPEHDGAADVCLAEGIAILPYYPLANGLLTGKLARGAQPTGRLRMDRYERFLADRNFDVAEAAVGFGQEVGLSPVQVALGWLLSRPGVPSVTPGATTPDQVASNALAGSADVKVDFSQLDDRVARL